MTIERCEEFRSAVPGFEGAAIIASVVNAPTPPELWDEMQAEGEELQRRHSLETLKAEPGIAATREAYKVLGKDPSRYRPACEQLARRVLQGKGLYSVNTLVDLGNLVSLRYGYSTGLLDADHVVGNVTLGVGHADEPYEGIGRGTLNIEHLPVYRDEQGPIATPTSDSTRTMLSMETRRLIFFVNAYDGDLQQLHDAVEYAQDLLRRYAQAQDMEVVRY